MVDKLIKTMADLSRDAEEAHKQWLATRRVGSVTYDPEINLISIETEHTTYDIMFDRISNARQFTEWMFHLNDKSWMTGQHFKDLLDCLEWVIREKTGEHPIGFYDVGGSS